MKRVNLANKSILKFKDETMFDVYEETAKELDEFSKDFPFKLEEILLQRFSKGGENVRRIITLKDGWKFAQKRITKESLEEFYSTYFKEHQNTQRRGQMFCNFFGIGPFPELFYTTDKFTEQSLINDYVTADIQAVGTST
jgi:hypothetical protein